MGEDTFLIQKPLITRVFLLVRNLDVRRYFCYVKLRKGKWEMGEGRMTNPKEKETVEIRYGMYRVKKKCLYKTGIEKDHWSLFIRHCHSVDLFWFILVCYFGALFW